MDPVTFIIQNIQAGATDSDIIAQLQAAGLDDESILEAFSDAYAELNLAATDNVLELLSVQKPRVPPPPTTQAEINKTKIIGVGMIFFGISFVMLVIVFMLNMQSDSVVSEAPAGGFMNIPMIPAPDRSVQIPEPVVSGRAPINEDSIGYNTDHLSIPIALELDYDEQGFSYQNACAVVGSMVPSALLVSCLATDSSYKFVYLKNNQPYCYDSTGNIDVLHRVVTPDTESCTGEPFSAPTVVTPPEPIYLEDDRYRALNFPDLRIEFTDPYWMSGVSLCLGELHTISWFANITISDVIVGIYQPDFNTQDIKTIGTFRGTNNPESIPGYGTFLWSVGVLRDGSVLLPGAGYRFVVQDADGETRQESRSFSIRQCQ